MHFGALYSADYMDAIADGKMMMYVALTICTLTYVNSKNTVCKMIYSVVQKQKVHKSSNWSHQSLFDDIQTFVSKYWWLRRIYCCALQLGSNRVFFVAFTTSSSIQVLLGNSVKSITVEVTLRAKRSREYWWKWKKGKKVVKTPTYTNSVNKSFFSQPILLWTLIHASWININDVPASHRIQWMMV